MAQSFFQNSTVKPVGHGHQKIMKIISTDCYLYSSMDTLRMVTSIAYGMENNDRAQTRVILDFCGPGDFVTKIARYE